MAKIIYDGKVYQEVSLKMFHEREVQDQLASRAELVFPGYHYAEFTALVVSETDSAKPDFVLIEHNYRRWFVGEVEMVRHDLTGHVLRQVQVFLNGVYEERHVSQIIRNQPSLDEDRLKLLIDNIPPIILVVADKMDIAWNTAINGQGAKMAIFEVFRREQTADLMFRVNGYTPEVPGSFLSVCSFDRSLRRLLRVWTPSSLPGKNGEQLEIVFDNMITEWVLMTGEDKAWLNPVGHLDIPRDTNLVLSLGSDGRLKMEIR